MEIWKQSYVKWYNPGGWQIMGYRHDNRQPPPADLPLPPVHRDFRFTSGAAKQVRDVPDIAAKAAEDAARKYLTVVEAFLRSLGVTVANVHEYSMATHHNRPSTTYILHRPTGTTVGLVHTQFATGAMRVECRVAGPLDQDIVGPEGHKPGSTFDKGFGGFDPNKDGPVNRGGGGRHA